jgi:nucleoside-diphosphate-sugar epimerase
MLKSSDTILITGGSGFCGINLVRYFIKKGYKNVKVIDIADFNYEDMKSKIDFISGDIRNTADMEKAFQDVKYVVHCAAALPLYTKEDIYSTEIQGTENVILFAKKNGVKRIVNISTGALYGIPDHAPLLEDDPLHPIGHYAISKKIAEEVCNTHRDRGMIISTIRTTPIEGPERMGFMSIYYDWIYRKKNIPIIGWGTNQFQLLDVEDFCEAVILCLTLPEEKVNQIFNIGTDRFTTMKEDFGAVLEYRGAGKKIIPLPAKPLNVLLAILNFLKLSPLYKWLCETAYKDNVFSVERAKRHLGFTAKYSNKETLIRGYQSYVDKLDTYTIKGITHRVPWDQGILKFVSWFF